MHPNSYIHWLGVIYTFSDLLTIVLRFRLALCDVSVIVLRAVAHSRVLRPFGHCTILGNPTYLVNFVPFDIDSLWSYSSSMGSSDHLATFGLRVSHGLVIFVGRTIVLRRRIRFIGRTAALRHWSNFLSYSSDVPSYYVVDFFGRTFVLRRCTWSIGRTAVIRHNSNVLWFWCFDEFPYSFGDDFSLSCFPNS